MVQLESLWNGYGKHVRRRQLFFIGSFWPFGHSMLSCHYRKLKPAFAKRKEKLPAPPWNPYVSQMFSYYSAIRYLGASSACPASLYRSHLSYFSCASPARGKKYQKTIFALFLGLYRRLLRNKARRQVLNTLILVVITLKECFFGLTGGLFSSGVIISVPLS